MGIKVSDENITPAFQDITCNLSFPSDNFGHTTLFAILGKSSSGIKAITDSVQLISRENRYEELDEGNVWISGITNHLLLPNKKTFLKTVLPFSGENNRMTNDTMDFNFLDHNRQYPGLVKYTYDLSILPLLSFRINF